MAFYLLTSSRSDFGIYLPLISAIELEGLIDLRIVVFGTHLSNQHGYTISEIQQSGLNIYKAIKTSPENDTALAVTKSKGETIISFADFWNQEFTEVDFIICLGDRYEMFAAVAASIPFNLKVAHIHGGETTLGAIDNKYRHSLSLFSCIHFCANEVFADRIESIIGTDESIHNVGALSVENINKEDFFSIEEMQEQFGIDFSVPTILTTFHPETVRLKDNHHHVNVLKEVLPKILKEQQVVITLPNADVYSQMYRKAFFELDNEYDNIFLIEHFGRKGYLSALTFCSMVLGNSSSGIIEAASFRKFVVNVGNRQLGRAAGENVFNCEFETSQIFKLVDSLRFKGEFEGNNIYQKDGTAQEIIKLLKANLNVE